MRRFSPALSILVLSLLASSVTACGGDEEPAAAQPVADAPATSGGEPSDEQQAAQPDARASEARLPPDARPVQNLTDLLGQPELTVYAVGPEAMEPAPIEAGTAVPFEAELRIINEGEGSAEIEQAQMRFEVWSEEGSNRIPCTSADDSTPPSVIDEGATIINAVARCTFPSPGEYEVRLYAAFAADELVGDFDIERYYAGRTEVTAQ